LELNKRKAIVIGATSGIGRELALLLTSQYNVGITGRRKSLLDELQALHPDAFFSMTLDNTKGSSLESELDQLVVNLGGLDLLVISSGTGDINEKLEFEIEKNTIDLNTTAFTQIAIWGMNYFIRQGHGHLVGITSIGGLTGNQLAPAYNATKAYQINYLKSLRKKAVALNLPVLVTDIRPGFVDTDMAKGPGRFWVASPRKAAAQILSAIQLKRKTAYITKRWMLVAWIVKLFG
jgi:short-subunit dehydrogenase